jgi:RNA polymerase sigma factor for flagellar operon FliA
MDNLRVMITDRETAVIRRIAGEVYRAFCPQEGPSTLSREDLYHYGVIGLIEAKQSYDPGRAVPWLAFAAFRIRGAMLDQLRVQPLIRVPQAVRQKVNALKSLSAEFDRSGIKAGCQTLADHLGWSLTEVHRIMGVGPALVPATESRDDSDDWMEGFGHLLTDESPGPEDMVIRKEIVQLVQDCLAALSPQDRLVITGRFIEGLKLREIAETLGCTAETVRLKQKKLENQIKACLQRQGWEADP